MMMQESEISNVPEEEAAAELQSETQVLHLSGEHRGSARQQRADDVAMTQCILCILLVLILFVLHWLKPEWQSMLLPAIHTIPECAAAAMVGSTAAQHSAMDAAMIRFCWRGIYVEAEFGFFVLSALIGLLYGTYFFFCFCRRVCSMNWDICA